MENQIILLGTKGGPAVRQGGAMPTASLLQMDGKTMVIDCGIGLTRSIADAGVRLLDVDAIFITHLHSDHLLELGPLIYTIWTTGLTRKIPVYGPIGIQEYWDGFMKSMDFDHEIRIADDGRSPLTEMVEINVFGEGSVTKFSEIEISALRVDHPPVTECYALRFDGTTHSVVFSADTCYFPPLAEFSKGANVLIHEAMLEEGVQSILDRTPGATSLEQHLRASHTMAPDVGRIAHDADVGLLVLNHLIPADDPAFDDSHWQEAVSQTWQGPILVGKDGMKISLKDAS
ncbi:MAG: MBL fold metallo-hydrolase [Rhizobiaceae bacterium]|nr:MBL fold metallo-hydrolase [Rhizobiaceae bacterium]